MSATKDTVRLVGEPIAVNNNFDMLRFGFAAMVFFVHSYALSGNVHLAWIPQVVSSEMAVHAFFVVSGFLIFMSYENTHGLKCYFEKRARRIYPAYFTIVMLCALCGGLLSALPLADYLTAPGLYRYLAANLVFLNFVHPDLPGVFSGNAITAVNGALWTLKSEVLFYLSVPLLVLLFKRIGYGRGIVLIYAGSYVYFLAMGELARQHGGVYVELQRQLPGQMMYFMAGTAVYYFYREFLKHAYWLLAAALVVFLLEGFRMAGLVEPVALAIVVAYMAFKLPYLGNFGKYGDFSYGLYVIHFPVLQTLVMFGIFREHPWSGLAMATVLVLTSAMLMWHMVEKPFLRKASHYVAVTN